MRPDLKLLLGMLLVCAFAVAVAGCAERPKDWPLWKSLGGIGFDLAGAAVHGIAGN